MVNTRVAVNASSTARCRGTSVRLHCVSCKPCVRGVREQVNRRQSVSHHSYTSDTSHEAEIVQLELVRQMPPSERVAKALRLTCDMMRLAKDAIRRRSPHLSDEEVRLQFIELHYGDQLAQEVRTYLERHQVER